MPLRVIVFFVPKFTQKFLCFSFPDEAIRETATQLINEMSDDDLCRVMPQLTQALRHETYEASPVAG